MSQLKAPAFLYVQLGAERFAPLCHSTYDLAALYRRVDYIAARANAGIIAEDIALEIQAMSAAAQVINKADPRPTPAEPFPVPYPGGPRVTPLDDLAQTFAPHRRNTRPTKTGDQSISAALRGLLQVGAARPTGIINRGRGEASITQLQALDRRGLADPIRNGRRIIGARLTALGWREAAKAVA
jgi:hypothetical protein